ncbi:hypothetical protein WP50_31410 [Lactiplantibacillus plantarum]|nr:hypothetical protein WP50_31410 [Lactiplantibacillus plantarum]
MIDTYSAALAFIHGRTQFKKAPTLSRMRQFLHELGDPQLKVVAAYPVDHPEFDDETAESDMASLIELITAVRSIRAEANAKMSSAVDLLIKTDNTRLQAVFKANEDYIQRFAHPKTLSIGADVVAPKLAMTQVISDAEVYIPLAELVDLDEEVKKLESSHR